MQKIIKNIFTVLSSNIILMALGMIISFSLPVILSVENYGLWQLYLYYGSYLGFFAFGFNDGMNLRYAGKDYNDLDKELFKKFLKVIIILSTAVMVLAGLFIFAFPNFFTYPTVFIFVAFNIAIFNINGFCIHLNQMTSRFKIYSIANIMERLFFVLSIPFLMVIGIDNAYFFIIINIVCRIITLLFNLYNIRDIVFYRTEIRYNHNKIKAEVLDNFRGGLPLMLGAIFSMLMATVPRLVVERQFTIYEYGIFSFGYSTINFILQIIVAMSTVFYPTLKKVNISRRKSIFTLIKQVTIIFGIFSLVGYYIIHYIILWFFPRYSSLLSYLPTLFPVLIYQSFNNLIVSNYARLYRLEKKYFFNNLMHFLLNFSTTYFAAVKYESMNLLLLISIINMQLWMITSNRYLLKEMNIKARINDYVNICAILVLIFIVLNLYLNLISSFLVFLLVLLSLLLIQRENIRKTFFYLTKSK